MKIRSNGKFNWYSLIRLFRKGHVVVLRLTARCNLRCKYCGSEFPGSSCWVDPGRELSLDEWICIIEKYENTHGKIKQVALNGGEPFLYKHILPLIKFLIEKGILVYIFSNLNEPFNGIPKSNRIRIRTTYHSGANKANFIKNLALYSKRVFVLHQELIYTWSGNPEFDSSAEPTIPGSEFRKEHYAEDKNYQEADSYNSSGVFYPKDEYEDKAKYDKLRKEKKGTIYNPLRK